MKDSSIKRTAEWQLLLGSIALPGVLIGAWLCDRLGRKQTMMLGFSGYRKSSTSTPLSLMRPLIKNRPLLNCEHFLITLSTVVFGLIIGCAYDKIVKIIPLFIIFYGLMLSSGNLGPGDMLGLLSSESYATAVRGTCYGISAAVGKAGAAIGTEVFTPIQQHLGKRWTFIIAAIVGVLGVLVTWLLVPDIDGSDLSERDEKFRAWLVEKGWQGEMGEEDLVGDAEEGIPESVVREVEVEEDGRDGHVDGPFRGVREGI